MTRQSVPFGTAFAFARAVPADYVDAAGATQTAAADAPRFDHDPGAGHAALGLLVEGRPEIGAADRIGLALADEDFLPDTPADRYTLLHLWRQPDGTVRRDAHFTDDPRGAWNALVGKKGRHALPAIYAYAPVDYPADEAVAADQLTWSEDADAVLFGGETWAIPAALATDTGAALVTETGAPIITEDQA